MSSKEFRVNELFLQFPEWQENKESSLKRLNELQPSQLPNTQGFEAVGELFISHLEKMIAAPPFYGNESDSVNDLREYWENRSGFTDVSIKGPYRKLLENTGLWRDDVIRTMVAMSFKDRTGNQIQDILYLTSEMKKDIPATISQRYIYYLQKSAREMTEARIFNVYEHTKIDSFQQEMELNSTEHVLWEQYKMTVHGLKLAEFSTVAWLTKPQSYRNPPYVRFRGMNVMGLDEYFHNTEYSAFLSNPIKAIDQSFRQYQNYCQASQIMRNGQ